MTYTIRHISEQDSHALIDIFNYYIENSFAAFPEKTVPYDFFAMLKDIALGNSLHAVEADDKSIVGFGLLKKYQAFDVFRRTAEVAYFILPYHTNKGLGSQLLHILTEDAKHAGIDTLLATISSLNAHSLRFHTKHGFAECGRLRRVGKRKGKDFDVVILQKFI